MFLFELTMCSVAYLESHLKCGIWKTPWGSRTQPLWPWRQSINNVIATRMLCSPCWIIWFLVSNVRWSVQHRYSLRGQGKRGRSLASFSLWAHFCCFQLVSEEAELSWRTSQMSVFHFSKSVVSKYKLHIFWQLYNQWCSLSILFPRVAQSIFSSEDRQS